MKKVFIVIAACGFLAACNNSANGTGEKKDSLDSAASQKKEMIDSSANAKKDVIDSTTEAKKEALEKKDSAVHADTTKKHK